MDVSGKVFFITGGAQGLGKAFAEALLGRGSKVCLGDIDETTGVATSEDFKKRFGEENVRFIAVDVTDDGQFEAAFKEAVSTFGRVDVMVNNAGILTEPEWEKTIQINFLVIYQALATANRAGRAEQNSGDHLQYGQSLMHIA
ncbi:15-hydroxyprostaglandin dehydrogenase [NAD(+)]-like [Aplysia californica]|uniref:15-hydroxyprostaglandin dehydrogenase [NAD(+)] n=1 Tax=Aplysia californica TaxID=6500 RepID=A0ABM1VPC1_APLCA|nr:15-hydroxyprostaglandin dehydrogenase [NAD(+)]-like [Aplysia californica]